MDFIKELRKANIERDKEWNPDKLLTISFRGNELGGEAGEALEVVFKLALDAVALGLEKL